MVVGCFGASGSGRLAVLNETRNSAVCQNILKENVRPSVCDLKLKRTWVLKQDNDPKHTSKSTSEWLWSGLGKVKKAVPALKPSSVVELQQFYKDEWDKIPPQHCKSLIASYCKRLIAVVSSKGGPNSY